MSATKFKTTQVMPRTPKRNDKAVKLDADVASVLPCVRSIVSLRVHKIMRSGSRRSPSL